jgi:hypothetical protein
MAYKSEMPNMNRIGPAFQALARRTSAQRQVAFPGGGTVNMQMRQNHTVDLLPPSQYFLRYRVIKIYVTGLKGTAGDITSARNVNNLFFGFVTVMELQRLYVNDFCIILAFLFLRNGNNSSLT